MTDRSEKPAEHSEKPPRRWRTLVLLGGVLILGIAVAAFAIFHNDHWTADDQVGGVSLGHPDDWAREGTQDAATFSPLQLNGQPPGATPEGWNHIIATLGSNPSTSVGVYVREHDEQVFTSGNLDALKIAVAHDLTDSRTSLQAPDNADLQVAGKPAIMLDGDIRPWGSTDSLRIRSYVITLDITTHRSVHIMFFAAPAIFENSQDAFAKVLASISLSSQN